MDPVILFLSLILYSAWFLRVFFDRGRYIFIQYYLSLNCDFWKLSPAACSDCLNLFLLNNSHCHYLLFSICLSVARQCSWLSFLECLAVCLIWFSKFLMATSQSCKTLSFLYMCCVEISPNLVIRSHNKDLFLVY